jgi:hypothetical protein
VADGGTNMLRAIGANICQGIVCATLFCAIAGADSIQLRDGRHLQGKYLGGTTTAVEFMTDTAVEYFPVSDVLVLVFDNATTVYKPTQVDPGAARLPRPSKQPKSRKSAPRYSHA